MIAEGRGDRVVDGGTLAVLAEDGDSEHSALLLPAIPRAGCHYAEFLLQDTGTPDCYIQLGVLARSTRRQRVAGETRGRSSAHEVTDARWRAQVCTGAHDVLGGTPAYQSDTGWCFSCHNGNLLHYDQGQSAPAPQPPTAPQLPTVAHQRSLRPRPSMRPWSLHGAPARRTRLEEEPRVHWQEPRLLRLTPVRWRGRLQLLAEPSTRGRPRRPPRRHGPAHP